MSRILACLVLAGLYLAVRPHALGRADVSPVAPIRAISDVAATMKRADRDAMSDAYSLFAKAVSADPDIDPVFPDVAALRRAHRAVLLSVWRGLLNNEPGKVPGLREALEGAFDQRIGSDDVLLNPSLKQSAAKTLADIAASLK